MFPRTSLFIAFILSLRTYACDVDVTIAEGASVSYCNLSGGTISASSGFVSYSWTGPQNSSSQTFIPTSSGTYTVEAVDAVGCVSTASIQVTINPVPNPTIYSSEGTTICPGGSGTLLNVDPSYIAFSWSTGSTIATTQVVTGGTYTVQVTNIYGCSANASIYINEPEFELLASSQALCSGNSAELSALGGGSYLWSTGETTSSITVSPIQSATYSVDITIGSCSAQLETTVYVTDMPSSSVQDTIFVAFGEQVTLEGPEGFISYSWFPQDDLLNYSTQETIFTGTESTVYTVNSIAGNGCERTDTMVVIVLKINAPTGFSPNGDNVNDAFVIPELGTYDGSLVIWNRWGDIVLEEHHYQNDWKGYCTAPLCMGSGKLPEGTYFYEVDIKGVKFTGFTTLKL